MQLQEHNFPMVSTGTLTWERTHSDYYYSNELPALSFVSMCGIEFCQSGCYLGCTTLFPFDLCTGNLFLSHYNHCTDFSQQHVSHVLSCFIFAWCISGAVPSVCIRFTMLCTVVHYCFTWTGYVFVIVIVMVTRLPTDCFHGLTIMYNHHHWSLVCNYNQSHSNSAQYAGVREVDWTFFLFFPPMCSYTHL